MNTLQIQQTETDSHFKVKVVPASSRTIIVGALDGMLKMRVTAVPEKGRANKSIIDFLAKKLGVNKKAVTIIAGAGSPVKRIRISEISADYVLERLNV